MRVWFGWLVGGAHCEHDDAIKPAAYTGRKGRIEIHLQGLAKSNVCGVMMTSRMMEGLTVFDIFSGLM